MQVLGSASRTWRGGTRMDSLDVEGMTFARLSSVTCHLGYLSQTESADEWSYQKGLEGGWIPRDPSQRLYPGLCDGGNARRNFEGLYHYYSIVTP